MIRNYRDNREQTLSWSIHSKKW